MGPCKHVKLIRLPAKGEHSVSRGSAIGDQMPSLVPPTSPPLCSSIYRDKPNCPLNVRVGNLSKRRRTKYKHVDTNERYSETELFGFSSRHPTLRRVCLNSASLHLNHSIFII